MLFISNIERLPQGIRDVVKSFASEFIDLSQDNLRAVLVYGSATGNAFRAGDSDINMAIIYKQINFNVLTQVKSLTEVFAKKQFAAPLILTQEYLIRSKDVFALEFSSIKQQHILIAGEDIFSGLIIEDKHIRFCCEQQLRGMILRLRQMYLESKNNDLLLRVLKDSLKALIPVLRELMRIKGIVPKDNRQDLLDQVDSYFGLSSKILLEIDNVKVKGLFKIAPNYVQLLEQYLTVLEALTEVIDRA